MKHNITLTPQDCQALELPEESNMTADFEISDYEFDHEGQLWVEFGASVQLGDQYLELEDDIYHDDAVEIVLEQLQDEQDQAKQFNRRYKGCV